MHAEAGQSKPHNWEQFPLRPAVAGAGFKSRERADRMNDRDNTTNMWHSDRRSRLPWRAAPFVAALIAIASMGVTTASAASWEQVKTFGPLSIPQTPPFSEDTQLGGVSGMAVNVTGAGGVDPGTVYTIGAQVDPQWHVARYSAEGTFELAWTSVSRCGPKDIPASSCPPLSSGGSDSVDVAVDQTTGNVYVFYVNQKPNAVRVYRADGTGPIAEFGELDASGTVLTSPEKLHGSPNRENIAVDASGNVYVSDEATFSNLFHRLMVFRPQTPGDYEHYVYAGQANDISSGFFNNHNAPSRPMVDEAGHVYISGETYIEEFDPTQPSTPICTFSRPSGGIMSATVNPKTGAVFYFTFKDAEKNTYYIHQLNHCNAQGKFVEDAVTNPPIKVTPKRGFLEAMTFNPVAQFGPDYSPGILYAGAPAACPNEGVCPPESQGQSSLGYMFAEPNSTEEPPEIVSESVTNVGVTSATLNAQVNPKGPQTRFVFQYITDAAFQSNDPLDRFAGATEAPANGALLGNGQKPLLAAVVIAGLSPSTSYHYRVVATSDGGTAVGPAAQFQTRAAEGEGLPDSRAYELVSPSQKNGGEVLPAAPEVASCGSECKPGLVARRFPVAVSPSREAVAYQGQPFSLNEGALEFDEYVSTRAASGWRTVSMSPPLVNGGAGLVFEAFGLDSSLTRGLSFATNQALVPDAPPLYRNIFSEPTNNRFDLAPLLRVTPPNRLPTGGEAFKLVYVGATPDLSRVFFEANDALTGATGSAPEAVDGGSKRFNLYEWHAGQLNLVNVQPSNAESVPGASFGSGFQLAIGSEERADYSNAIAANGALVFWSSESGQVYVRENGERTREIPDPGQFLTASVDGSKVLLDDGIIYDLQTGNLTDLTAGSGGFEGIAGQSDDLSTVYFVASTVLTDEPNGQGTIPKAGGKNLYAWRNGVISFVATVLAGDNTFLHIWSAAPVLRTAEASPDGRWLAFNSKAALTGHNTVGACSFSPELQKYIGSVPCEEVYLYDSQTGSLVCPSCSPTGAAPLGGSFLRLMSSAPGSLAQPRYLTNSGRLYFDTRDELSVLDTNNQVEDVYQYEPANVGSCARAGGCVALISSGRGLYDSNFLAIDSAGDDVFFTTRQQLVPRDQDSLIDLYDARVGGGLAADYAVPRPECLGEGCQPPPPPVQGEPSPGSAAFQGPGNLKPKKAKKKHHKKKHKHHKKKQNGKKHKKKNSKHQGSKAKHGRGGSK